MGSPEFGQARSGKEDGEQLSQGVWGSQVAQCRVPSSQRQMPSTPPPCHWVPKHPRILSPSSLEGKQKNPMGPYHGQWGRPSAHPARKAGP